ncbi:hypothetical protein [Roseibium sp. RKSG952]|uniref:hypothetical protein n=1 Tax=Roseibium sp. RKSG952 TaxID=2529384 RepID=UPI0012BB9BB0|nr:hypothetical protein [Roseibium sp. RKSG952]MTH95282.1 hypothetical protein [Roseibium sp. RKSG952]
MTAIDHETAEISESDVSSFKNFLISTGRSSGTISKRLTAFRKVLSAIDGISDFVSIAGDGEFADDFWMSHLASLSPSQAEQSRPLKRLIREWLEDAEVMGKSWRLSAMEYRSGSSALRLAAEACGAEFAYSAICPPRQEIMEYFGSHHCGGETEDLDLLVSEFPFSAFAGSENPDPIILDAIREISSFVDRAQVSVLRVDWTIGRMIGSNPGDYLRVFEKSFPELFVQAVVAPYKNVVPVDRVDLFVVASHQDMHQARSVAAAPHEAAAPRSDDPRSLADALGFPERFPVSFEGIEEALQSSAAVPVAERVIRGILRNAVLV